MKAMILCAGLGTRLGELTRELPKPMLPLCERPLLAYLLGHLRNQGFEDVLINLHFRPEIIRDAFQDGGRWRMRITYSLEESLRGTAGGLKNVQSHFSEEECFLVQYGDVLTDQDFQEMVRFHRKRSAMITLLLHERSKSNSAITLDESQRILGFLERPTDEMRQGVTAPWVNSGVCICSPEIFDHIPTGRFSDLPRDIFVKLVDTGRLYGFPLTGFRCAIDSASRLEEARLAIARGDCHVKSLADPDVE
ncbi:MAG: NDP-sugar synthase [Pedosphaera sp.]|nr:NDP-sugar synthase [Pedosphaera sp.]